MQFDWPRAPSAAERAASAKTKLSGGEGPSAPLQRPWGVLGKAGKRGTQQMAMWTLPTAVSTWLGSTAIKSSRADLSKLPALSADAADAAGTMTEMPRRDSRKAAGASLPAGHPNRPGAKKRILR